jgi:hypothetical protein
MNGKVLPIIRPRGFGTMESLTQLILEWCLAVLLQWQEEQDANLTLPSLAYLECREETKIEK